MTLIESEFTSKHPVLYRIVDANNTQVGATISRPLAERAYRRIKGYTLISDIPRRARIELACAGFCNS